MRVEFVNPFIKSLANTFDVMLQQKVTRGDLELKSNFCPLHPVSGIIGLSGKATGTVVLSLSEVVALKAASTMLMTELSVIDDDVTDAVGELVNMVTGGAKAELEAYNLSISLPGVVTGKNHSVNFPSKVTPICVPFSTEWGPLALEVGLITSSEIPAASSATTQQPQEVLS